MSTPRIKARSIDRYHSRYELHSLYFEGENGIIYKAWWGARDDVRPRPVIGDTHFHIVTPIKNLPKTREWRFWIYPIVIKRWDCPNHGIKLEWAQTSFNGARTLLTEWDTIKHIDKYRKV